MYCLYRELPWNQNKVGFGYSRYPFLCQAPKCVEDVQIIHQCQKKFARSQQKIYQRSKLIGDEGS